MVNQKEYNHFCRMLAAVLDRATKAEQLQFDLEQANKLIKSLRDELKKEHIVSIANDGDIFTADAKWLPGSPPIGRGITPTLAIKDLMNKLPSWSDDLEYTIQYRSK